jgi:hypothetical protein
LAWLTATEESFEFWNNTADAVYDEDDDLTALPEALFASSKSAEAGQLRAASAILDELGQRR